MLEEGVVELPEAVLKGVIVEEGVVASPPTGESSGCKLSVIEQIVEDIQST